MTQTAAAVPGRYTNVLVRQRDGRVVILRYSNDPANPSVRLLERLDLAPALPHDDEQLPARATTY